METTKLRWILLILALVFSSSSALAKDAAKANEEKLVSGMSIVGNDEAPKSLVIVPWKSSDLGETLNVSKRMDDGRGPVDREVFVRALDYYEIRRGAAK
jgi:hypothetical protein